LTLWLHLMLDTACLGLLSAMTAVEGKAIAFSHIGTTVNSVFQPKEDGVSRPLHGICGPEDCDGHHEPISGAGKQEESDHDQLAE
jgi:hypothetical protein